MAKNKENKKNYKPIKYIIAIAFFILSIALVLSIHRLNIVPTKFMIIGIIGLLILNTIANLLLFSKKIVPKVFACIIYLILIVVSIIGIHFTTVTNNFLDKAFDTAIKTQSLKFYVISPNEHEEKDLENQDIYYYNNSTYVDDAITKLNEKHKNNMVLSEDITTIYNNEFFLIDEGTLNMFEEDHK